MYKLARITGLVSISLLANLVGACALEPVDDAATPYRDDFALINNAPFTTELPGGQMIDVWVTESVANEYAKISLDASGSNVIMPEGTVIVREVLDDHGRVETLTLMIKNAPGYFPGGGDWWYGVADPDGLIRQDENGEPIMGALQQCNACHVSRAADGYLYGVPTAYH